MHLDEPGRATWGGEHVPTALKGLRGLPVSLGHEFGRLSGVSRGQPHA